MCPPVSWQGDCSGIWVGLGHGVGCPPRRRQVLLGPPLLAPQAFVRFFSEAVCEEYLPQGITIQVWTGGRGGSKDRAGVAAVEERAEEAGSEGSVTWGSMGWWELWGCGHTFVVSLSGRAGNEQGPFQVSRAGLVSFGRGQNFRGVV